MIEIPLLQDLLILLILALANALLFSKLRQSPLIGYLATGILAGPYGLHLISNPEEVELIAEIGVILLMFTIGLEFSFSKLLRLKGVMIKGGLTQVLLTMGLVFLGSTALGVAVPGALVLGMALALSSTAIILKLLMERGEVDSPHGRLALAILLFQDLCVILFLIGLPLLNGEGLHLSLPAIGKGVGLMVGLLVFVYFLLDKLLRVMVATRAPELFRLTILGLALGTAWITAAAGLSLALGSFLAGLALSESEYSHQVVSDILPFRDTFLALFFISIGMLIDLEIIFQHWPLLLILFLGLCLLKTMTGTIAATWAGYPLRLSLMSGLILFQVGEFSFVLLKEALNLGLLESTTYQLTLALVALSMMATPALVPRISMLSATLCRMCGKPQAHDTSLNEERAGNLRDHVIIAGYGVSGRSVSRVLRATQIPYIHLETNGRTVRKARNQGEFILFGDATSGSVLSSIGIDRAKALVLAINDPAALRRIIQTARQLNPQLYILARSRFLADIEELRSTGADMVIPDEVEAGLQLAANLLHRFSIHEAAGRRRLTSLRQEHYRSLESATSDSSFLGGHLSILGDGDLEFQAVPDDSPCLFKTLIQLDLRRQTGAMVAGVVRQGTVMNGPLGDIPLQQGDTLMLLGDEQAIRSARELIHGHSLS